MGLPERLHAKGWSQAEIDHAVSHMAHAQSLKSRRHRFLEEGMYWLSLLLLAAGVVTIVRFLIPFLTDASRALGWPTSVGFTIVVALGVVVGILFAHLLHDIADLEPRHHSMVLFLATLTVAVSALAVSKYDAFLAGTFATVFVLYYSIVWWNNGR